MKSLMIASFLLLGLVSFGSAQIASPAPAPPNANQEQPLPPNIIGNTEIQSELIASLEDHHLSGVTVKVTDEVIELSGKLPSKDDQQLAHDVAAAYADHRTVHDHTTR